LKKLVLISAAFLLLYACSDSSQQISNLQKQVFELQKKVDDSYKPGLGEFMSNIQIHHAKLWFAGINKNWKLAKFEIDEISETIEDIKKYESDREEIKMLPIIIPAIDSIKSAINNKSLFSFKTNFAKLTSTCNACHKEVHYEFNKIKVPDSPPFSNQVFEK
jgi:hypothetical protein